MKAWGLVCVLAVFPLAAALHHAVFFRPTCMLNPFGPDYTLEVVSIWLRSDPSPWIAAFAAAVIYRAFRTRRFAQFAVLSFVIAFAPLAVWIWDLPFTARALCGLFHDEKGFLRTRHLYILGVAAWLALVSLHWRRSRVAAKK